MGLFKRDKKKMTENNFLSFSEIIRKNVQNYTGPHYDIIRFAPDFFDLLIKLYKKDIPHPYKAMVNAAISYFVLPDDLLPEDKLGAFGYLDDLYLCAYIINKSKNNERISKLIEEIWNQPIDVFIISAHIIKELEATPNKDLKEAISSILAFTGIAELEKDIMNEVDMEKIIVSRNENLSKKDKNFVDIDILLEEAEEIGNELRKTSISYSTNDEKEKREEQIDGETLWQNELPVYILLHMARKAKYNNILSSAERKALYEIAQLKLKNRNLTQKQISYLEYLINKAIEQGIVEAPCEDDPCEKCEELREIVYKRKNTSEEYAICPYCHKKFKSKEFLMQHIKRSHPDARVNQ